MLGNPTVATLPFALPPHGHNFQYTTVYINGVDESCRLCRYPPCLTCSNSPKASILHVDCFKLAKSELLIATLSPRRLVELARSHPPAIPRSYVIAHTASVTDLGNIMRTLEELPPELRDMIASYCCESRWWRCLTIIAWLRQLANPLSRWTEAVQARLLCGFLYSTTETKLTSISMTLEEMVRYFTRAIVRCLHFYRRR